MKGRGKDPSMIYSFLAKLFQTRFDNDVENASLEETFMTDAFYISSH